MGIEVLIQRIREAETTRRVGWVRGAVGLVLKSDGPPARVGELCFIYQGDGDEEPVPAEVVGFSGSQLLLMAIGETKHIGLGSRVVASGRQVEVGVTERLLGRVVDGLGRPIDGGPEIEPEAFYPLDASPPPALKRRLITEPLELGVRAIDACLTCGRGQRIGIFSGAGVGKSTLLGMIARHTQADVNVIALVGERGREVREFITQNLGSEGLERSVVVVATSDQPPLVRIKCAQVATAIAEYFRDRGMDVVLMMDSVTRVAWAMREVGLAIGEPPTRSGYTPSVFAALPRLMERAGTSDKGSITGLYAVLVEGDDLDDPVADTVRGILDGHIVLSRELAARGHYPAIDILRSISRLMPSVVPPEQMERAEELRRLLAAYAEAEDLINLGAYQQGSNPLIDRAIALRAPITEFLRQRLEEYTPIEESRRRLEEILAGPSDAKSPGRVLPNAIAEDQQSIGAAARKRWEQVLGGGTGPEHRQQIAA
ncbi:MAG: FliI/YscN family ATPase [Armatimonadetes bacterium]|nr:FliI/YscN family ATPase [Armatimonadota bacterium]